MKRFVLIAMLGLVPGVAVAQWAESEPAEEQPQAAPQTADGQAVPAGQWVYTQQYGWIWMPYGDAYSSVPASGSGEPYQYVYYPSYGWTWIGAPWIWGYGPWPYFGAFGPARFGWYGHGWWRTPGRWSFRPGIARGAFGRGFAAPARFGGSGARFAAGARYAAGRHPGGVGAGHGGVAHFTAGRGHSGGGGRSGGGHGGGHR